MAAAALVEEGGEEGEPRRARSIVEEEDEEFGVRIRGRSKTNEAPHVLLPAAPFLQAIPALTRLRRARLPWCTFPCLVASHLQSIIDALGLSFEEDEPRLNFGALAG